MESANSLRKAIIIGGGPAGLTAAYELTKIKIPSIVLEKDSVVGGLAKTVEYKNYYFDIGGHRFFTKVSLVDQMWKEVLQDDFLHRGRLSRIYYNKKFFYYPLRVADALFGLGLWNSTRILLSYIGAQVLPHKSEETFEQWVSNRFGRRLYEIFFKTYTEKVWGIPCSEIRAEWASQRIRGLSLLTLLRNTLLKTNGAGKDGVIKTLIDAFEYPKYGPGMMWKKVTEIVSSRGSEVRLQSDVAGIVMSGSRVHGVEIRRNGNLEFVEGTDFISSMPLRDLIRCMKPSPAPELLEAAEGLHYRDFLTVALIVKRKDVFPDNWIYIHDPEVKVGRIQNFKNWSPYMVPDENTTCLGLEYFCFEGDGLWSMSDQQLIELGGREAEALGLISASDVIDGAVVREQKAYPVYDSSYQQSLEKIRTFLSGIENLQVVGRNGMHRYNNQDHSMLTAMLAVRNMEGEKHDLWAVNADQEYHEEVTERDQELQKEFERLSATQPRVPSRISAEVVLIETFARMDKLAFSMAVGTVCGLGMFFVTAFFLLKGEGDIAPNLNLLAEYFIGYTVSWQGAFLGMGYSFIWGALFGWLFAYLRNLAIGFFIYYVKHKAESASFRNLLDYV